MGYDSEWSVSCDEEWVSIDASSGTGDGYFIVTVEENDTGEPRNAYLSFISMNEQTLVIVHQSDVEGGGGSKLLWSEPKKLEVGYESASTSVTVYCVQGDWSASTSDSGLTFPTSSGGTGATTFPLVIQENTGSTERTGSIILSGTFGTYTITIS